MSLRQHRTGCLVACFRKWHNVSVDDALSEYRTFAHPKTRPFDELFIESFNRNAILQLIQDQAAVGNNCTKDEAVAPLGTMATGGNLDKGSYDELQPTTTLRTAYACPKLLGS